MTAAVLNLTDFAASRVARGPAPNPQPLASLNALIVVAPSLGGRKYHLDRGVIRVARDAWAMIRAGLEREYRLAPAGAYGTDGRYEVFGVAGRTAP